MSVQELAGVLRSADKNGNKYALYPMTKIDLVDGLRNYLESLEVSKTVTGSVLAVENSANLPLLDLKMYGKSAQNTTTGAQLWNHETATEQTQNGVTYIYDNGVYTINGMSTRSFNFILGTISLDDGTYTLSANNPSHNSHSEQALIQVYSMTTLRGLTCLDNKVNSFGTQEMIAGVDYELRIRIDANVTYNNFIVKPMLNKGSAVLPWELYTGGIPSPNPNFPQEIVNIGDAGSVDVGVYGGNLLDYSAWRKVGVGGGAGTLDWKDDGVVITATANDTYTMYSATYGYTYPVSCTPNTTYTMSWDWSGNADDRVFVFFNGLSEKNVNVLSDKGGLTFRTLDDTTFFTFRVGCSTAGTTSTYKNVQFNLGDTALLYEPYKSKQVLIIPTPNGLPGIQVTEASLANYTDPYGNMWCCDEVDFGRGVYVKRVYHKVFDGTESYALADTDGSRGYHFALNDLSMKYSIQGSLMGALCNKLCEVNTDVLYGNICQGFAIGYKSARFRLRFTSLPDITTVNGLKAKLAEWYANGEPLELITLLATPIETPLSEEELAAYKALHTNCPNTTVMNDKNAEMSLTYYSKRYNEAIDFIINKIENNRDEIQAMKDTVEVTLLSSNWSGSTAPYTQTVSAPGITEDDNPTLVTAMHDGISESAKVAYRYAFSRIAAGSGETNNGSVTFYVSEKPTVDIVVGLKGV